VALSGIPIALFTPVPSLPFSYAGFTVVSACALLVATSEWRSPSMTTDLRRALALIVLAWVVITVVVVVGWLS
jgi:uncharacterized membrane protein